MNRSESIKDIAVAMAKAQAVMKAAPKDHTNPAFPRSRYADLASVWEACREALTDNGVSVLQVPSTEGKAVTVETLLMHASGEWVSGALTLEAKDAQPQSVGSAITYARRYGLASMVGVSPEDDDGEAAMNRNAPARSSAAPRSQTAPPAPQPRPAAARAEPPPPKRDGRPYQELAASGVSTTNAKFRDEHSGAADIINGFQLDRHLVKAGLEADPRVIDPSLVPDYRKAKATELGRALSVAYQTPGGYAWIRREMAEYLAAKLAEARDKAAAEGRGDGEAFDGLVEGEAGELVPAGPAAAAPRGREPGEEG